MRNESRSSCATGSRWLAGGACYGWDLTSGCLAGACAGCRGSQVKQGIPLLKNVAKAGHREMSSGRKREKCLGHHEYNQSPVHGPGRYPQLVSLIKKPRRLCGTWIDMPVYSDFCGINSYQWLWRTEGSARYFKRYLLPKCPERHQPALHQLHSTACPTGSGQRSTYFLQI